MRDRAPFLDSEEPSQQVKRISRWKRISGIDFVRTVRAVGSRSVWRSSSLTFLNSAGPFRHGSTNR